MATTQAPGTGIGPGRRRAVVAAAVLACAAIVVPFGLHSLQDDDAPPTTTAHHTGTIVTPPAPRHHSTTDTALGSRADLPPLLPNGSPSLRAGQAVRIGDVTEGTLRRTTGAGWQVLVRWDGRLQPLPVHGPVTLGEPSWVSRSGLLYTRVATGTTGRFRVFAWVPQGGSAYSPPELVATPLGAVCFNGAFTAFGNCAAS